MDREHLPLRRPQHTLGRLTPIEFEILQQAAHRSLTAPTQTSQPKPGANPSIRQIPKGVEGCFL